MTDYSNHSSPYLNQLLDLHRHLYGEKKGKIKTLTQEIEDHAKRQEEITRELQSRGVTESERLAIEAVRVLWPYLSYGEKIKWASRLGRPFKYDTSEATLVLSSEKDVPAGLRFVWDMLDEFDRYMSPEYKEINR